MARIEVSRRAGGWGDRARRYKLLVDGEEVGRVGAGEVVAAEVETGEHEVGMKVDWCRSRSHIVELGADQTASFECWPNANPLTVLWYITGGVGNYIGLEPAAAGDAEPPPPPPPPPPV